MSKFEMALRLAIIAVCVYLSVTATIDFYQTSRAMNDMPIYPTSPNDPLKGDYIRALWLCFGIHTAASAVAICASGQYAMGMWLLMLVPFHAPVVLILAFLCITVAGLLGSLLIIATNWLPMLIAFGALIGTAAAGYGLALLVVIDQEDRETRRERARHDARWRS